MSANIPRHARVVILGGGLRAHAGCPVAMGYVNNSDGPANADYLSPGRYAIDVAGELLPATLHLKAPCDPRSERVKA